MDQIHHFLCIVCKEEADFTDEVNQATIQKFRIEFPNDPIESAILVCEDCYQLFFHLKNGTRLLN